MIAITTYKNYQILITKDKRGRGLNFSVIKDVIIYNSDSDERMPFFKTSTEAEERAQAYIDQVLLHNELQVFGREHLNVNEATKEAIIKRYNSHPELLKAIKKLKWLFSAGDLYSEEARVAFIEANEAIKNAE